MSDEVKLTPMMEQYWEHRNSLPKDTLLFFRLGDFYEMFCDDAIEGSKILGITLTKRGSTPMAGIPYHSAEQYVSKLLASGKKIAVCEQDEVAVAGKLVKRSINKIITRGTTLEDNQLDSRTRNFILSLDISKDRILYCAWLELSTGEFYCAEFKRPEDFLPLLSSICPKEIILPEAGSKEWKNDENLYGWHALFRNILDLTPVTLLHDYRFDSHYGSNLVKEATRVYNIEGFGIENDSRLLGVSGALIFYVTENLRSTPENLRTLKKINTEKCMLIDIATQKNLEIFRSTNGLREGSLINAIDKTKTSMGARLLESFLSTPILDIAEIQRRQNIVWDFYSSPSESYELCEFLRQIRDIPRILGRLYNKVRNPKELGAILNSIEQIEPIRMTLRKNFSKIADEIANSLGNFTELSEFLKRSLSDELPSKIQDGGIIRKGFDEELDRLRGMSSDSKMWLANLESEEQRKTGIKNLRIKYNGAYGYFIEVTKSYLSLVPSEYMRKQTMTNAERYTTEELKKKEREILCSEEASREREETIFNEVVENVLKHADELNRTAKILAEIDVFIGWAEIAREWDYCRPIVTDGDYIEIEAGRHPVVEQMLKLDRLGFARTESFVPNDLFLSSCEEQIALITGPNMAGKSTYIRQSALIVLLAQIGCFVPAKKCRVGIVDKIFSRVGASDELSKGNSTFMVEMNETANILNNATHKSLIILDEIGRGTSTYDGLSIAWGVVEYLHGDGKRGPKTLFATHYHEITKLAEVFQRIVNYRVSVKEWNDEIIFVRKIEKGAADKSYGIQVARLAGLPQDVISRAKEILKELESEGNVILKHLDKSRIIQKKTHNKKKKNWEDMQMSLF